MSCSDLTGFVDLFRTASSLRPASASISSSIRINWIASFLFEGFREGNVRRRMAACFSIGAGRL